MLSDSLDKFTPSVTRKSRMKKRGKFVYNKEIAEAKQIRRQLERQCRKSKCEIDKQMLKSQQYKVRHLALKQKAQRIMSKMSKGNSRHLFEQVR